MYDLSIFSGVTQQVGRKNNFPNPCIVAGKSILRAKENATYKKYIRACKISQNPRTNKVLAFKTIISLILFLENTISSLQK